MNIKLLSIMAVLLLSGCMAKTQMVKVLTDVDTNGGRAFFVLVTHDNYGQYLKQTQEDIYTRWEAADDMRYVVVNPKIRVSNIDVPAKLPIALYFLFSKPNQGQWGWYFSKDNEKLVVIDLAKTPTLPQQRKGADEQMKKASKDKLANLDIGGVKYALAN